MPRRPSRSRPQAVDVDRIVLEPNQYLDLDKLEGWYREGQRHLAILYCTGGGKTEMALAFSARLRDVLTHAVFAAPTEAIRDGFDFGEKVYVDRGQEYKPLPVLKHTERANGLGGYLALRQPSYSLRITHALANSFLRSLDDFPKDALRTCLLVFDEVHHLGERQQVRKFRDRWLALGGCALDMTATPDRSDRTIVIPPDIPRVERSLSRQMADKRAPEELLTEPVAVAGEGVTDKDTYGEPVEPQKLAEKLLEHLRADDNPKAIVRFKNTGSVSKHLTLLLACARHLTAHGLRVYIASPAHAPHPVLKDLNFAVLAAVRKKTGHVGDGTLDEVLKHENRCAYGDSCVDVILGIQAVLEGINWKMCSHVYFVGVPLSLLPFVQGSGRATRCRTKIVDYPEAWRNTSKVVLMAAGTAAALDRAAVTQMLRAVCYLSKFRQWGILQALSEVFDSIDFATPEEVERARKDVEDVDVPDMKAAEILWLIHEARSIFESRVKVCQKLWTPAPSGNINRMTLRLHAVAELTAVYAKSIGYEVELRDIHHVLLAQNHEARIAFRTKVQTKTDAGVPISDAVRQAHAELIAEFKHVVQRPSSSTKVLDDMLQTIRLNAKTIDFFAKQVEAYAASPEVTAVKAPKAARQLDAFTYTQRRLRGELPQSGG